VIRRRATAAAATSTARTAPATTAGIGVCK
jgi:hypothetical protein